MNVKIKDLMAERVISAERHHTVDHVRGLMERHRISAVPVLGADGEAVGIVTATDLVADLEGTTPVDQIMTMPVHRVPAYNDVHVAARVMRNHRIHHVVVTHEREVVGIISSFDLLELVEDRRFVSKNAPDPAKRKGNKRDQG